MDRFSWALVLHFAMLTSLGFANGSKTLGQQQKPRQEQIVLKPRHPEWTNTIIATHPNGQIAKVRFFEDDVAVKEISYYENGAISEEVDLIEIDQKPAYHGAKIQISRENNLHSVVHYREGKMHGPMRVFFPTGLVRAEGEFMNGLEQGTFNQYYEDGSKFEETPFVMGKREGESIQYHPSGRKARTVQWKGGKREGKETSWFENGVISTVSNYVDDKLQNEGSNPAIVVYSEKKAVKEIQEYDKGIPINSHIQYYSNGKERQRVTFKEGKIDGSIVTKNIDGKVIGQAQFKMGVPYGYHFLKHDNGNTAFEGEYDNDGKIVGFIHEYNEQGQLLSKYRRINGQFDGENDAWYPNGNQRIASCYKDGKLDGEVKSYFENGKLQSQGRFVEGKRDGRHLEFNEKGEKIADIEFKMDVPSGKWMTWFEGGKQKQDISYVDGKKSGLCKQFAANGQILLEANYIDDKIEGEYKEYHENGAISVIGVYVNGKSEGTFKGYYPDASIRFQRDFKDGKPAGEHKDFFEKVNLSGDSLVQKIMNFDSEGVFHGEQRSYHPNGLIASVVNYDAGVLQGLKAAFDLDGRKIEEAWFENGKLHGPYLSVDQDGRETVLNYVENKKEGPYVVYHKDAGDGVKVRALEGTFKNSKVDGELREYNIYGDLVAMTTYKNGKKEGLSALYGENGKVLMTVEYLNDVKEGRLIQYFPSGIVAKKAYFKNDQQEGTLEEFYPSGSLYNRSFYKHGVLDGVSVSYSEEGVKIFEGEYDMGKKSGLFNKYTAEGALRLEQRFESDTLIYKKTIDEKGKVTEHAL